MKILGIYEIYNKQTGQRYIGSAVSCRNRWCVHKNLLNNNKHHSNYLQHAWNKYGKDNFEFRILETVFDKKVLIIREQYYLRRYKSYIPKFGYNMCKYAGNTLGYKHSDKVKVFLKQKRGKKHHWFGKVHSLETKSLMAKPKPKGFGKHISLKLKGRKKTKSHCRNLSLAKIGSIPWNKGLTNKEDARISTKLKSPETKAKMRKAALVVWQTQKRNYRVSEETRDKLRLAALKRIRIDGRFSGLVQ